MQRTDLGLLGVRVCGGLGLALLVGFPRLIDACQHIFLGEAWRFSDHVARLGFPLPVAFASASALAESFCAVLMAAGFWTRCNAAIVALNMMVAVYSHVRFGQTMAPAVVLLAAAVAILVGGAGSYSIDHFLRSRARGLGTAVTGGSLTQQSLGR